MQLHTTTVSPLLQQTLMTLMKIIQLQHFRLTNGTAFSLQLGHRQSKEIDLFTDQPYSDAEFAKVKTALQNSFGNGEHHRLEAVGKGTSFFIYNLNKDYVKIDVYYSSAPFLEEPIVIDHLRMATMDDLVTLKLERLRTYPTKQDYWDLHAVLDDYPLAKLMDLHQRKYGEQHNRKELLKCLTNFTKVDEDFPPNCYQNKNWHLVKLDFLDLVRV